MDTNINETEPEAIRLPLWERCLEAMRETGIAYGVKFDMAWLESQLRCNRDTLEFGAAISSINDEIIIDGYYLSSRDQSGQFYKIVDPANAELVADHRVRRSFREIRRAIALFGGILRNPTAGLNDEQKRRLASKEEKNQIRLALMQRPGAIGRLVKSSQPKLLS